MSRHASYFAIFNPAAGRGDAGRIVDAYRSRLRDRLGPIDSATTQRQGDEAELADRALAEGRTALIAVGGDGTWSKVADRIVRSGRRDVALGLLPAGTGNDFAKSLGIRTDRLDEAIQGIAEDRRKTIDVGRVGSRHFLNVIGFGFDIAVIDDAATFPVLRGDALYRFCALRQLFKFRGLPIGVSDGTAPPVARRHLMLTVSNGNFFGGSFRIAPRARLDDGLLDAVSIYDTDPIRRASLFSKVMKGTHEADARVAGLRAERFCLSFEAPVRYEVDGDVHTLDGTALTIEAVPRALDVFVPAY